MKKYLLLVLFVSFAVILESSFGNVVISTTTTTINVTTVDLNIYAQSTSGDLTEVDGIQWGVAYSSLLNTPSTTLQYDIASDWSPTITIQNDDFSGGVYDKIINYQGVAGSDKTISGSGKTLLATIRFTKADVSWGTTHVVKASESSDWGCYIYNNSSPQTLEYPSGDQSLPVEMTNIIASSNPLEGIVLQWITQSEVDCAGFHVHRSESEFGLYNRMTNEIIPAQGNSSSAYEYSFVDNQIQSDVLYWYKIEEISTSGDHSFFGPIAVQGIAMVPSEFRLSQNYPNPFNPVTHFEYDLATADQVKIEVYNILGKRVKTLVNEKQEAGYYTSAWNGLNEYGQKVSSGIYFIRMEAGQFSKIRKIALQR